jgi:hypothetical protein
MTNKIYAKDLARAMSETSDKMYTIYECQDFLDIFQRTIEELLQMTNIKVNFQIN